METWRVGALNIDATRIPYANDKDKASIDHKVPTAAWSGHTLQVDSYEKGEFVKVETNELGRFPSNVLGEIAEPYQKYFYCPKVSRSERHIDDSVENNHPTVKPIELMKYLIKLITPPGGIVLDPFNGSGSTGCAAVALDHEYIGCELDPAYIEISKRRIEEYNKSENNFDALFE
jgi:site-specific DNA-methyltransferase (adenine-specific)